MVGRRKTYRSINTRSPISAFILNFRACTLPSAESWDRIIYVPSVLLISYPSFQGSPRSCTAFWSDCNCLVQHLSRTEDHSVGRARRYPVTIFTRFPPRNRGNNENSQSPCETVQLALHDQYKFTAYTVVRPQDGTGGRGEAGLLVRARRAAHVDFGHV